MKKIIIILLLIGSISIVAGFITDRSVCLFLNFTGIPCPSCGMTRAFISLFRGDLAGAFNYHPLFIMPAAIVIINHKKIRSNKVLYNRLILLFIVILLAVYVIRLIMLFPDSEPLVFYSDGLLPKLFNFIKMLLK
ncbi:UNVERIFIED_CONTAM: uncharacterized protein DUF2752 [Acetivibrio alkalicellulosi]